MPPKVLVAHGNTQRLKQAVSALQGAGFAVVATPDGGDAFARFFDEEPDVVLCSLSLPSLPGDNFAKMVLSQSPDTRVFLMADQDTVEAQEGLVVLREPFDIEELRAAVPEIFDQIRQEEAALPLAEALTRTQVFIAAALRRFRGQSDLLGTLDAAGLEGLARVAEHRVHDGNEQVIRQGEIGEDLFLVVEGQVRVTLEERNDQEIARIGPGGFFGEMALLSDSPRSASVWTAGPTTLLRFPRDPFLEVLQNYPNLGELLTGVASQRREENLWRVLFADDEVQRSLAELDVAMQEDLAYARFDEAGLPEGERTGSDAEEQALAPAGSDPEGEASVPARPDVPATTELAREGEAPEGEGAEAEASASLDDLDRELDALQPQGSRWAIFKSRAGAQIERLGGPGFLTGLGAGLGSSLVLGIFIALATGNDRPREAVTDNEQAQPPALAPGSNPSDSAETADPSGNERQEKKGSPSSETHAQTAPGAQGRPAETDTPRDLSSKQEEERKELRRSLLAAYRAKKFDKVVEIGRLLREKYRLDWEAHFKLAEAEAETGDSQAALATFQAFFHAYSKNKFADDARFRAAEILRAQDRQEEAKALYRQVATDPQSDFNAAAKQRLSQP